MKLTKDLIGKFITRTGRNKRDDGSWKEEKGLRVLNVKDDHAHLLYHGYGLTIQLNFEEWDDGKWAIVDMVPDNGCDHILPIRRKLDFCYDCGVYIGHLK